MGNIDSIPVVSQAKSLTQFAFGNATAATETQNNFLYHNTFPVLSQINSAGYAIAGDNDKALDLQKKFADDMIRIVDSIPVAGHIKGGIHYALGENEEGDQAMKAASRSTGVVLGGVGGFIGGGPAGAVAGGIAGGAAMDGLITGAEVLIKKDEATPYGYVAIGKDIADAVEKEKNITVEQGFDMAMLPIGDGIAGFTAGRTIGKPLGLDVAGGKKIPPLMKSGPLIKEVETGAGGAGDFGFKSVSRGNAPNMVKPNVGASVVANEIDEIIPHNGNYLGLDKSALDNRANQLNPNHVKTGPGKPAGYKGAGSKADLDNHANQLNPNSLIYRTG